LNGNEVIVTKNGKEIGRFIPKDTAVSYLTDSLSGILSEKSDHKRLPIAQDKSPGVTCYACVFCPALPKTYPA
jgi:hypothetical protein